MPDREFSLCLVSDRRRLARSLGRSVADAESLLLEQIAGAAAGGIDLIQIREPDLDSRALMALVRRALAIVTPTRARVVVNDRSDVAKAARADGVHLRETSVPAQRVRRLLGSDALIGRSVHDVRSMATTEGADYVIAGTVFPTASKSGVTLLGVSGLSQIAAAAAGKPILAIGGISATHIDEVRRAGASGVAAIGMFIPPTPVADLRAWVQRQTAALRATGATVQSFRP
jgi:thiamine-phosphate pyrophosphorylase